MRYQPPPRTPLARRHSCLLCSHYQPRDHERYCQQRRHSVDQHAGSSCTAYRADGRAAGASRWERAVMQLRGSGEGFLGARKLG